MSDKVITMDLKKYVHEMQKQGLCIEKKNDYAVMCPICYERHKKLGDASSYRKLHLWVDKSFKYSHCFRDGTVFISEDESINTEIKRLESPINLNYWNVMPLGEDGFWKLSRFNTFDEDDPDGINYLAGRLYYYRKLYKNLGIKFYKHNPVTPFYYKGELIYYQIRIIHPEGNKKYHSPSIEHKPPYIVEKKENKKFLICEGTYDANAASILYPDRTAFAVLGSDITDYQIGMLRSYIPEDILIYMDKTELSIKIRNKIEQYIDYASINIRPSDGTDPEEYLRLQLIKQAEND